MFRGLKEFLDYSVTTDGDEIGFVDDFYVDTNTWIIRYLATRTGGWLEGRRALLSMAALKQLNDPESILLNVSKETIQNSPDFLVGRQITRQQEIELLTYYDWPFYWTPGETQGLGPGGLSSLPLIELEEDVQRKRTEQGEPIQTSLISARAILESSVQTRDGEIGSAVDLIVNPEDWKVAYLIVELGSFLPGRKVLVIPSWIDQIDLESNQIVLDLKSDTVQESPEYTSISNLNQEYEDLLAQHYNRHK